MRGAHESVTIASTIRWWPRVTSRDGSAAFLARQTKQARAHSRTEDTFSLFPSQVLLHLKKAELFPQKKEEEEEEAELLSDGILSAHMI